MSNGGLRRYPSKVRIGQPCKKKTALIDKLLEKSIKEEKVKPIVPKR